MNKLMKSRYKLKAPVRAFLVMISLLSNVNSHQLFFSCMYIVPIFLRKYDLFRRKTVLFTEFFRRIRPAKHKKAGVSALFVPCWLLRLGIIMSGGPLPPALSRLKACGDDLVAFFFLLLRLSCARMPCAEGGNSNSRQYHPGGLFHGQTAQRGELHRA